MHSFLYSSPDHRAELTHRARLTKKMVFCKCVLQFLTEMCVSASTFQRQKAAHYSHYIVSPWTVSDGAGEDVVLVLIRMLLIS